MQLLSDSRRAHASFVTATVLVALFGCASQAWTQVTGLVTNAATGVPVNALALDFALGRPSPLGQMASNGLLQAESASGACVLFLVAPEGTLRAVAGVEEAERHEGVRWVRIYRRPGWRFGPLRRGADRAGAILAVGSSREDALERARRAAEAVRFAVDADTA